MRSYETFSTTADAGIRFRGRDFSELYANALRGLNLLLFGRNPGPQKKEGGSAAFCFHGDGPENVLVNFLAAVVALANQEGAQVAAADIHRADARRLEARLRFASRRRAPKIEIKATTYHNLRVSEKNGMLRAAVVFDV
ncbi:MAG: archease [Acidobacteria bacterium]|jgi:SHS2 domain-containing protein|nr:archease [Acidobacteriota bacterium]